MPSYIPAVGQADIAIHNGSRTEIKRFDAVVSAAGANTLIAAVAGKKFLLRSLSLRALGSPWPRPLPSPGQQRPAARHRRRASAAARQNEYNRALPRSSCPRIPMDGPQQPPPTRPWRSSWVPRRPWPFLGATSRSTDRARAGLGPIDDRRQDHPQPLTGTTFTPDAPPAGPRADLRRVSLFLIR